MIDLHIHTTASSDGVHSPAEIFDMARRMGIEALAFADHDTIGSVAEGMALARQAGIRFISGIEISTQHHNHDLHMLAYGFDPSNNDFTAWLKQLETSKWEQARGRLQKLKELGFAIEWEKLIKQSGGNIPSGMNFVKTMLASNQNDSDSRLDPYRPGGSRADSPYLNFYLDYLRGGKPAFCPQDDVQSVEVIKLILALDAVPVLAHPSDTPDEFMPALIEAGLRGLEVYSSYHDDALTEKWLKVAKSNGLLITAGSDFHGLAVKPGVHFADIPGNTMELFDQLVGTLAHKKGVV